MPIPEPSGEVWSQVVARLGEISWPGGDEDRLDRLSEQWSAAGGEIDRLAAESGRTNRDVRTWWRDPAGDTLAGKLEEGRADAQHAGQTAITLADQVTSMADVLRTIKQTVTGYVQLGQTMWDNTVMLLPPHREQYRAAIVDATTERVREANQNALDPTAPGDVATKSPYNQLTDAFAAEMKRNAASGPAALIRAALDGSVAGAFLPPLAAGAGITAGALWAAMVRTGGPWDHKTRVRELQGGTFTPLPGTPGKVSYEIWSNIHYGYVGRDIGFPAAVLHAGANGADLLEHGQVDRGDQAAVQIGIELRNKYGPGELRPEHIDEAIRAHYQELKDTGKIVE